MLSHERIPPDHALHPTGEMVPFGMALPQGTVRPGPAPLNAEGPRDWEDLIPHTGEARGVADTAYHSLEPDAPTQGCAERGHRIEDVLEAGAVVPGSGAGPD